MSENEFTTVTLRRALAFVYVLIIAGAGFTAILAVALAIFFEWAFQGQGNLLRFLLSH